MNKNTVTATISCPFCRSYEFELIPGKVSCPVCLTDFDIDDRGECVFVDRNKPKLPIKGIFCTKCGLVQYQDGETCLNCGAVISRTD